MSGGYDYIRDGAEIYRNSFAIIRREANLARFDALEERVAVRIIHASGMVEITPELAAALTAASDVLRMEANGLASFNDARNSASREGKSNTTPARVYDAVSTEMACLRGISDKLLGMLPPKEISDEE